MKMQMELLFYQIIKDIRDAIRSCQEEGHVQQVVYTIYHDALTQVCFTCQKVRTSISQLDLQ